MHLRLLPEGASSGSVYLRASLCATACHLSHVCCAQANSVRLFWNATGSALLAMTASDVDVTNQSYYGEQKIHYLAADGNNDCLVPNLKVT